MSRVSRWWLLGLRQTTHMGHHTSYLIWPPNVVALLFGWRRLLWRGQGVDLQRPRSSLVKRYHLYAHDLVSEHGHVFKVNHTIFDFDILNTTGGILSRRFSGNNRTKTLTVWGWAHRKSAGA